jgi:hypothetical protein
MPGGSVFYKYGTAGGFLSDSVISIPAHVGLEVKQRVNLREVPNLPEVNWSFQMKAYLL